MFGQRIRKCNYKTLRTSVRNSPNCHLSLSLSDVGPLMKDTPEEEMLDSDDDEFPAFDMSNDTKVMDIESGI